MSISNVDFREIDVVNSKAMTRISSNLSRTLPWLDNQDQQNGKPMNNLGHSEVELMVLIYFWNSLSNKASERCRQFNHVGIT